MFTLDLTERDFLIRMLYWSLSIFYLFIVKLCLTTFIKTNDDDDDDLQSAPLHHMVLQLLLTYVSFLV